MASGWPEANYHTKNDRLFVEDIEKATGGKLKITIHSNQSLYKLPATKQAVQTGQVHVGELASGQYSNEDPVHEPSNIPFLAVGFDKASKLWGITKPLVTESFAKQGIRLLYGVPWPRQGFYTKEPVASADSLKGVKFRIYSTGTARMAELLGALPTRVEFSEMPQAFATGLIGAMYTSAQTGIDSHAWDFTKYFTDVGGNHAMSYVIANERFFQELAPDVQKAVLDAASAAEKRGWQMAQDVNKEQVAFLKEKGMVIDTPTPEFRAQLDAVGKQIAEEWVKKVGAVAEEIVKKLGQ